MIRERSRRLAIGDRRSPYVPIRSLYYPTGKQMVLYTNKEKLEFKWLFYVLGRLLEKRREGSRNKIYSTKQWGF